MPPKAASSTNSAVTRGPTKEQLQAINNYLAQKPDFNKFIAEAKASSDTQPATKRTESGYEETLRKAVQATLQDRKKEAESSRSTTVNMPVHPKEEEAQGNLYDKVAKESKDSGASDHPLHHGDGEKANIEHHKATPGPVKAENLPEPASKEELRTRAAELNKKT